VSGTIRISIPSTRFFHDWKWNLGEGELPCDGAQRRGDPAISLLRVQDLEEVAATRDATHDVVRVVNGVDADAVARERELLGVLHVTAPTAIAAFFKLLDSES